MDATASLVEEGLTRRILGERHRKRFFKLRLAEELSSDLDEIVVTLRLLTAGERSPEVKFDPTTESGGSTRG